MIKSDIVDLILQTEPCVSMAVKPERGLVSRVVGMALNSMYFKIFSKNVESFADYRKSFSITPVFVRAGVSTLTLPAPTLQTAEVGDSIIIINPSDRSLLFAPITEYDVFYTEQIDELSGVISFIVKGNTITLYGLTELTPLVVEAIPEFQTLLDTDNIKIPSGTDVELFSMIRSLMGFNVK